MSGLNIDAVLSESEPKPLTYKGKEFTLPGELPGASLAPFLADDLGLIDLLAEALGESDDNDEWTTILFNALKKRPNLPAGLLNAAKTSFRELLGDEQYHELVALKPSVNAYAAIASGIASEYGMGLSDFFASGESSETETDGTPSKQTSPATTQDSTPEASGESQEPTDS